MKLTFKQRAARLVLAFFGEPIDDPRLDFTSHEHPAFTRGFSAACVAVSRDLSLIDANTGMTHRSKCKTYARLGKELNDKHLPKITDASQ